MSPTPTPSTPEPPDDLTSPDDAVASTGVPSTTETSEGSDVTPHNLAGDLPVEGDGKA